jgi:hypothetical protein
MPAAKIESFSGAMGSKVKLRERMMEETNRLYFATPRNKRLKQQFNEKQMC